MRRASSARLTWRALRSASEYTATVRTPSARAVRITRHAISPRLAIRTLPNTSVFSSPPGRLALLEERGDALLAFGRDADLGDAPGGVRDQRCVHSPPGNRADQFLDPCVRFASASEEVLDYFFNARIELVGGNARRQKADAAGLGGVEYLGGEEIAPRGALADRAHHVRADRRRRQAELRLREAELRLRRADGDVAGGHQPRAAGEGRAVNARDGRLGQAIERGEHVGKRARIGEVLLVAAARHALHPVEVGAGAEHRAIAGQHDDAGRFVSLELGKTILQGCNERLVKCIADLGPVERDPCDALFLLDQQIAHAILGSTRTSVLTELAMKHFSCARSCNAACSCAVGGVPAKDTRGRSVTCEIQVLSSTPTASST